MLTTDDMNWIAAHATDDVARLRLRHGNDPTMQHLIMQVESRRKYQKKLPRTLACKSFEFPTALSGEQCTSDRLAEFHAGLIADGERIIDLTAGLGIDATHFAEKARTVIAIEHDSNVAGTLAYNATALGADNMTVINADCTEWIRQQDTATADTVFIDPARRGSHGERIFALNQCAPDVTAMLGDIATTARRLIVKMSPMLDISQTAHDLPGLTDMYAIGTPDECKELVAVVDMETASPHRSWMCHAVTLKPDGENRFSFSPDCEAETPVRYGLPADAGYLYEPYPAVMKAAPYRQIARLYGVTPLHPNTHIYASAMNVTEFPGTVMKIDEIIPFSSTSLRQLQKRRIEASVTTRNFSMNAATLRARIKSRESSSHRLFGLTVSDDAMPQCLILAHVINQTEISTHNT